MYSIHVYKTCTCLNGSAHENLIEYNQTCRSKLKISIIFNWGLKQNKKLTNICLAGKAVMCLMLSVRELEVAVSMLDRWMTNLAIFPCLFCQCSLPAATSFHKAVAESKTSILPFAIDLHPFLKYNISDSTLLIRGTVGFVGWLVAVGTCVELIFAHGASPLLPHHHLHPTPLHYPTMPNLSFGLTHPSKHAC